MAIFPGYHDVTMLPSRYIHSTLRPRLPKETEALPCLYPSLISCILKSNCDILSKLKFSYSIKKKGALIVSLTGWPRHLTAQISSLLAKFSHPTSLPNRGSHNSIPPPPSPDEVIDGHRRGSIALGLHYVGLCPRLEGMG